MRIAAMFGAILVLGFAAVAAGQYYGGYGGYHASTAGEGYQRGFADVLRSQGMRNLMNSQAAINLEDARSKNLDNRLKYTETYFEKRRVNKSYRDSQRKPRLSSEQLHRIAAQGKPSRLDATQVDPITGAISWPLVLRQAKFADLRQQLQDQFARRAKASGVIGYEEYQSIQETVDGALSLLKEDAAKVKPNDYIAAKKFLQSLAYEAGLPIS